VPTAVELHQHPVVVRQGEEEDASIIAGL
jgi:hypothetical protein